jgi:hypothetical protein
MERFTLNVEETELPCRIELLFHRVDGGSIEDHGLTSPFHGQSAAGAHTQARSHLDAFNIQPISQLKFENFETLLEFSLVSQIVETELRIRAGRRKIAEGSARTC